MTKLDWPEQVVVSRGVVEVPWAVYYWRYDDEIDTPEEQRQYDFYSGVESLEADEWYSSAKEAEDAVKGRLGA